MKRIINQLDWIFDYYIAYLMYNDHKMSAYYKYMIDKWNINLEPKLDRSIRNSDKTDDFIIKKRSLNIPKPKENTKVFFR